MKNKKNIHLTRFDAIKKYVRFNYNTRSKLSAYDKHKIKRYYDEITALRKNPHYVYHPRKAENRRKATEYAVQDGSMTELKVVFLPVSDAGVRPKMTFKKDGLHVSERAGSGWLDKRVFAFDKNALVENAEKEIERLVNSIPKNYDKIVPLVDQHALNSALTRDAAKARMKQWVNEYDGREGSKSDYRDWLHGVRVYDFTKVGFSRGREMLAIEQKHKKVGRAKRKKESRKIYDAKRYKEQGYREYTYVEDTRDKDEWRAQVEKNRVKRLKK